MINYTKKIKTLKRLIPLIFFCLCHVFVVQIIARVSVDNRTRALVKGLQRVTDVKLLTTRVEELSYHLLEFPETRGVAVKVSVYFYISSSSL